MNVETSSRVFDCIFHENPYSRVAGTNGMKKVPEQPNNLLKYIATYDSNKRKLNKYKDIGDFAHLIDFSPWRIIDYLNPERRGNPHHNWMFAWLSHEHHEEIMQLRRRILNVLRKHDIDVMHKIAREIEEIEVSDDVYEAIADFELQRKLMPNA